MGQKNRKIKKFSLESGAAPGHAEPGTVHAESKGVAHLSSSQVHQKFIKKVQTPVVF